MHCMEDEWIWLPTLTWLSYFMCNWGLDQTSSGFDVPLFIVLFRRVQHVSKATYSLCFWELCMRVTPLWNKPQRPGTYLRSYAPGKDSDQPAHTEALLGAFWIDKEAKFHLADNKDSDQTAWMRSLIRVFVGRTCKKVRFLTLRLQYEKADTPWDNNDCSCYLLVQILFLSNGQKKDYWFVLHLQC